MGASAAPSVALVAAADKAETLFSRLDPVNRTKVVMALLALVLVAAALVALVVIGGRRLRRIAGHSLGPTPRRPDDWFRKPLAPRDEDERAAGDGQ
jgi:hypothetical protein